MRHLGTMLLETPRLLLRPFAVEDAKAMYANWASDSEVTKYLTWQPHKSVLATEELLRSWCVQYADPSYYMWAIVPRELSEPIGSISVVQKDDQAESVQIGYCIAKAYWQRGYTSEALEEVIRYFFEQVGVGRVEARHGVENANSGKVMRKCGMQYEGTLRKAGRNNQGICDMVYYGIVVGDFWSKRNSMLQQELHALSRTALGMPI